MFFNAFISQNDILAYYTTTTENVWTLFQQWK